MFLNATYQPYRSSSQNEAIGCPFSQGGMSSNTQDLVKRIYCDCRLLQIENERVMKDVTLRIINPGNSM